MSLDHFAILMHSLDAVFPLDTRISLDRPGLSPQPKHGMGDAGSGTASADYSASASRPADVVFDQQVQ